MIDTYRERLEQFHETLCREKYLHFAGLKDTLDLTAIFSDYSDLFQIERISELRHLKDAVSPDYESRKKQCHRLLGVALQLHVEARTRDLTGEIATVEARTRFRWKDRDLGYHEALVYLTNETDPGRRRELSRKRNAAVSHVRRERLTRLSHHTQTAGKLGFDSYLSLFSFIKGQDYDRLAGLARRFLARTQDVYNAHLVKALRQELGMETNQVHRCDIAFFQRQPAFDTYFPADGLLPCYRQTLAGLGIDLTRLPNLHVDTESRPNKHPRAFCAPVKIPDEVRLVMLPRGGHDDYAAVLHEGGHALHYSWSSARLPVEDRYCGDPALSELHAFLFNYLLCDSGWLAHCLRYTESARFRYLQSLFKLYMIRRYAAKVLFEVALHHQERVDEQAMNSRYQDLLGEATGFSFEGEEFLEDLDDGLYAADYFRAWIAEAQWEEYLRTRFGRTWYLKPKAGDLLKEIWETGELYTLEELCREFGFRSDDPELLEIKLGEALTDGHDTR